MLPAGTLAEHRIVLQQGSYVNKTGWCHVYHLRIRTGLMVLVMISRVSELIIEIRRLENELEEAVKTHEVKFFYRIEGTKVRFEQAIRQAHQRFKIGIWKWLRDSELRNWITFPVIYAMIFPLLVLDISVSLYQVICFPLYRIPIVRRNLFIAVDRHQLSYLNAIEKLHCFYCGYASSLIAYSREIIACTEQYWCPIKHARKIIDPHRRYARFADFGEAENYQEYLLTMRNQVREQGSE